MLTYRDLLNVLKKWEEEDDTGMDDPVIFCDRKTEKLSVFDGWGEGHGYYALEKSGLSSRNPVMMTAKVKSLREIQSEKEALASWIQELDDFFIPDGPYSTILCEYAKHKMEDMEISYKVYAEYNPSGLTFCNLTKDSK